MAEFFQLCDFGFRGSTSLESGSLGGCAHLTSFKGTDNIEALRVARTYYGPTDLTVGYSCPASERRFAFLDIITHMHIVTSVQHNDLLGQGQRGGRHSPYDGRLL